MKQQIVHNKHQIKVSEFGRQIYTFDCDYCKDCGQPMETKREEREGGYSETVSYCNCGNTYIGDAV